MIPYMAIHSKGVVHGPMGIHQKAGLTHRIVVTVAILLGDDNHSEEIV